jgi:hypothetical protein
MFSPTQFVAPAYREIMSDHLDGRHRSVSLDLLMPQAISAAEKTKALHS